LTPTRPRIIKWYCPFAAQTTFPTGHRYCINVYTGCAHGCLYCYARGYEPEHADGKRDFAGRLAKDLDDLERFDVPPAPVHLSNSTDPFQSLETRLGHTKHALEGLLAHRRRFSTVTLLTKNPTLAAYPEYAALLRELGRIPPDHPMTSRFASLNHPTVQVEVSLAFWQDQARAFWDPAAPSVPERLEGIQALRAAGIPVVMRIDPLLPRSPLSTDPPQHLGAFGLPEAQSVDDLEHLVAFAKRIAARHIVYSPAKIALPRRSSLPPAMQRLLAVYRALSAPGKPVWRGGSWRLPPAVAAQHVTRPFLGICERLGVHAKFCMTNLLETI
jgi:DNA repair photolyase